MSGLVVSIAALTALTACGSSGSPSGGGGKDSNKVDYLTLQTADRQKTLEAAACKEGAVTLYGSVKGDDLKQFGDAFHAKYPCIKVTTFASGSQDIVTKIKAESDAHSKTADVVETSQDPLKTLAEAGVLASYYSPNAAKLSATFKKADSSDSKLVQLATFTLEINGFSYNTKKVPANLVPNTFNDLANPDLAKHLLIASESNTGARFVALLIHELGKDKAVSLLKTMAHEGTKLAPGSPAVVVKQVSSGAAWALVDGFKDHAAKEAKAGNPVQWKVLGNEAGVIYADVAVPKAASHPAAAALLADFMLSSSVDSLIHNLGLASTDDKLDFKLYDPAAAYPNVAAYNEAFNGWSKIYNETFG